MIGMKLIVVIFGLAAAVASYENCCRNKTVGNISYSLTVFGGNVPANCLNSCVYTQDDDPDKMFCFARGTETVTCHDCYQLSEDSYQYKYYTWPATANRFTFEARGSNAVLVLLSFCDGCNGFEIVIGGWSNTYSVIREYKQEPVDSLRTQTPNILSTTEMRRFWINVRMEGGGVRIEVGEGTEDMSVYGFMSRTWNSNPYNSWPPTNVAFAAWHSKVDYKFCLNQPGWIKVFSQDTAGGLFTSDAEALSKNPDDPAALLFSRLDQLEDFRTGNGNFHLKIVYPELGGSNEWIQTSNPATDSTIEGFQSIKLDYQLDGRNNPWGGLGLYTGDHGAFISDTPTQSQWFMCIGCQGWWPGPETIPGPKDKAVTRVELYINNGYSV